MKKDTKELVETTNVINEAFELDQEFPALEELLGQNSLDQLINVDQLKQLLDKQKELNFNPEEKDYLFNLATNKFHIGDYLGASQLYQTLLLADNNNPMYMKALAGCSQAASEYLAAYIMYQSVYKLTPDDHDCLFYCGVCLDKLDQIENAKTSFEDFLAKTTNEQLKKRAKLLLLGVNKKINRKIKNH